MIKPEDLRIGDLVRTNRDCAFPKGTMCVVVDIRYGNVFKDKKGTVGLSAVSDNDDGPWGLGAAISKAYLSLSNSSKRTTLNRSNTKRTAIPNG